MAQLSSLGDGELRRPSQLVDDWIGSFRCMSPAQRHESLLQLTALLAKAATLAEVHPAPDAPPPAAPPPAARDGGGSSGSAQRTLFPPTVTSGYTSLDEQLRRQFSELSGVTVTSDSEYFSSLSRQSLSRVAVASDEADPAVDPEAGVLFALEEHESTRGGSAEQSAEPSAEASVRAAVESAQPIEPLSERSSRRVDPPLRGQIPLRQTPLRQTPLERRLRSPAASSGGTPTRECSRECSRTAAAARASRHEGAETSAAPQSLGARVRSPLARGSALARETRQTRTPSGTPTRTPTGTPTRHSSPSHPSPIERGTLSSEMRGLEPRVPLAQGGGNLDLGGAISSKNHNTWVNNLRSR